MRISQDPSDLFGPLRELRSPATTGAIRQRLLERGLSLSLWHQLKSVAAEVLVVGIAATAMLKIAGPVTTSVNSLPSNTHRVSATTNVATTTSSNLSTARINERFPVRVKSAPQNTIPSVNEDSFAQPPFISNCAPLALNPPQNVSFVQKSKVSAIAELHPQLPDRGDSRNWYASMQGGAMFSEFRIAAERGEIGFQDGWETFELSYTNGYGSRDTHDELLHHPGVTAPFLSKQSEQQVAMMLGAATTLGPIELHAMVGPAYFYSSSRYFNPPAGAITAPVSSGNFGVSAEVSALYNVNSFLQAGISGIGSYSSSISNLQRLSGLFLSVNYRLGL